MKCLVTKKLYCPILERHVERGETIDVDKKHIEGYMPYVEIVEEVQRATKKEPEKKTADKKVK